MEREAKRTEMARPAPVPLRTGFLLLLLLPALHAAAPAWQAPVMTALFIAMLIPVLIYVVAYVLHSQAFMALAREEVGQAVMTAILAGLLISSTLWFENNVKYTAATFSGAKDCTSASTEGYICKTMNTAATGSLTQWALEVNDLTRANLEAIMGKIKGFTDSVGKVSARSQFCSLAGVGFSVAGCSSFGVLRGPTGQMMMAVGTGLMDVQAEQMLLNITQNGLTFNLLMPLGILLRALHWTRKAGGIILAIAISLYLVFPAVLLVGQGMADAFVRHTDLTIASGHAGGYDGAINFAAPVCAPEAPDAWELMNAAQGIRNSGTDQNKISAVTSEASIVDRIIFQVFARALLVTVLALTVTMGAIRVIGHMLATEIDVTAIARMS